MSLMIFDGALGTMLQQRGLKSGENPESLNLRAPETVKEVHRLYLEAGADIVTTNSFGGTRIKLCEYSLEDKVKEINVKAVEIAKQACVEAGRGMVAASVGPTGRFAEPLGDATMGELIGVFKEQISALASAKPDYIILETFSDVGEAKAAVLACKEVCDIPVIASFTFTNGRTLTGSRPSVIAVTMEALGVFAVGCNCSGGPKELLSVIKEMAENTALPLIVEPNAGLPILRDNEVCYPLSAKEFASETTEFLKYEPQFLGGCCGTSPEHIELLKKAVAGFSPAKREPLACGAASSREEVVRLGKSETVKVIGERINPTARKKLAEAIRNGEWQAVQSEAMAQIDAGADLLDVNVGAAGIDEKDAMLQAVKLLSQFSKTPLVLDNTVPDVLEAGLLVYHGKALVNSVNGEEKSLNAILPIVKKYGAGVVALTLDENGIPESAEGRFEIAKKIVERCDALGIKRNDIYVDCLTLTVATDIKAPSLTLCAMKRIKSELGVNLILGVSNISYGLPARSEVNGAFLAMAIDSGLDVAIMNPLDANMMNSLYASTLLSGRDFAAKRYLEKKSAAKTESTAPTAEENISVATVIKQVVSGNMAISQTVERLVGEGINPLEIINDGLIAGLNEVGEKYEKGEFFLPQLMLSAETAEKAFASLEKYMSGEDGAKKGTMVIGTVKGDIHDIGKNMVAVMVKNHGYNVIDLGKNVSAEAFVNAAIKNGAEFLGLSALMTTTMREIPKVIRLIRKAKPDVKVVIGGAVITEEYADEVGADGYGKDAVSTVKLLEEWSK